MNISSTECTSGCDSGWTMYFDQFSNSADQCNNRAMGRNVHDTRKSAYVDEDEDLSMVSDASSGPPHLHDDEKHLFEENGYAFYSSYPSDYTEPKQRKIKEQSRKQQHNIYLDDTASSQVSGFPKENIGCYNDTTSMEQIVGFSETHSKGKSVLGKHFGFLKTSVSGKAASSEKSGSLKGRKRR